MDWRDYRDCGRFWRGDHLWPGSEEEENGGGYGEEEHEAEETVCTVPSGGGGGGGDSGGTRSRPREATVHVSTSTFTAPRPTASSPRGR
jgi:hypothetical protein